MKESPGNSIDREPEVDPSQDYQLLLGYENNTHTVLRFRRRLDTCDHHDIPITVSGNWMYFSTASEEENQIIQFIRPFPTIARSKQGKGGVGDCCFVLLQATVIITRHIYPSMNHSIILKFSEMKKYTFR